MRFSDQHTHTHREEQERLEETWKIDELKNVVVISGSSWRGEKAHTSTIRADKHSISLSLMLVQFEANWKRKNWNVCQSCNDELNWAKKLSTRENNSIYVLVLWVGAHIYCSISLVVNTKSLLIFNSNIDKHTRFWWSQDSNKIHEKQKMNKS